LSSKWYSKHPVIDDKGIENSVKIEIIAPSREKSSKDKGGKKNIKQDKFED